MPSETRPLYLRDSRHAGNLYNQQSAGNVITENQPRHKFNYFINIEFSVPDATNEFFDIETITALVKTFDGPRFSIDTQTLNQYNKKRIIQTRINFDPITITLHDVVDGKTVKLWEYYYRYYFKDGYDKLSPDGQNPDPVTFSNDILKPDHSGGEFGIHLDRIRDQPNLIDRIELYTIHGREYSRMDFIHPRIQQFTHDTYNYEDTSGVSQLEMQIVYEDLIYVKKNVPLTDDLATRYANGDFNDVHTFYRTLKSPTVKKSINTGSELNPETTNSFVRPGSPGLSNNLPSLMADNVGRLGNTFNTNNQFDAFQSLTNSFGEVSETALSTTLGNVLGSVPTLDGTSSSSIFNSLFTISPINTNSSVYNTTTQNPRSPFSNPITTNNANTSSPISTIARGFGSSLSRFV